MHDPRASAQFRILCPRSGAAAVLVLAAALAACEPTAQEQAARPAAPETASAPAATPAPPAVTPRQTVTIRVTPDTVLVSPTSLEPGPTAIEVTNETSMPYDVDVDGPGPDGETENLRPGETRSLTMDLRSGTYEIETSPEDDLDREREARLTVGQ